MKKLILIALAIIGALIVVVLVIGFMLPVNHVATRSARFDQPPEKVFLAITEVEKYPQWRPSVERVEVLPPNGTHPRFREIGSDGSLLFETDSVIPNKRVVNRIADKSLPFGGRWIYDLSAEGGVTRLTITEEGEVYNAVYRFVSRFIMGYTRTIDRYLNDLEAHLR